ncbi:MAG: alcohol dehydrogenase [Cereibacter sphaeroides]|uniref:Alcohol dehydrogenase n=1 Tax=Cereibacter sphaeroides TaxID=1063 RepID=A0A2W5S276_CERSP|nr:MAG: alcohol dehydrogenase [Cereibacter sphaeroides]
MAPFQLLLPGRILFGRGEAAKAAGFAKGFGSRVLLVHGRNADRAGWLLRDLSTKGLSVTTEACAKEPDLPMLEAALTRARAEKPDCVIGLGGGAVLDLAKALAALIPASGTPLDHLEGVGRGLPLSIAPLPFIAVPTTAGTGSEATKNAVIDVPEHRRKVSLRDDRMLARMAIMDPALTDNCPHGVTLASGLDALTQVIEPYVSSRANPATDAICRPAIPKAIEALMGLMAGENPEARDAVALASLTGGVALANSGLGAVHGLAGVIGGMTGAAHGAICGTLLPFVIRANLAAVSGPIAARLAEVDHELAKALGAKGSGADALHRWSREQGLPGLTELGLKPADYVQAAEAAQTASSMAANPVKLPTEVLVGILRDAA